MNKSEIYPILDQLGGDKFTAKTLSNRLDLTESEARRLIIDWQALDLIQEHNSGWTVKWVIIGDIKNEKDIKHLENLINQVETGISNEQEAIDKLDKEKDRPRINQGQRNIEQMDKQLNIKLKKLEKLREASL